VGVAPPPPNLTALAVFPVITGLFVLAWLAVPEKVRSIRRSPPRF